MMKTEKFCVDCDHSKVYYLDEFSEWMCRHPNQDQDIVTGRMMYTRCASMRSQECPGGTKCGPDGKWFVPKRPGWFSRLKTYLRG